jgi:hypothetical protein
METFIEWMKIMHMDSQMTYSHLLEIKIKKDIKMSFGIWLRMILKSMKSWMLINSDQVWKG